MNAKNSDIIYNALIESLKNAQQWKYLKNHSEKTNFLIL